MHKYSCRGPNYINKVGQNCSFQRNRAGKPTGFSHFTLKLEPNAFCYWLRVLLCVTKVYSGFYWLVSYQLVNYFLFSITFHPPYQKVLRSEWEWRHGHLGLIIMNEEWSSAPLSTTPKEKFFLWRWLILEHSTTLHDYEPQVPMSGEAKEDWKLNWYRKSLELRSVYSMLW